MNRIKKIITTAAVALTTVAMIAPAAAGAVTIEELQAQINSLLAQLATLQGTSGGVAGCSPIVRTLAVGSTGSDVMCAQKALNALGYKVAMTGPGSMGMETSYFGSLTLAAVKQLQMARFGYSVNSVGPLTRGVLNGVLSGPGTPATPTTPGTPSGLVGGAGDITVSSLSTYSLTKVGEGENDKKVVAFEVEADSGSDVAITSLKLEAHQESSADDRDINDYMEKVTVWMDGTKIGEVDTDDFSDAATTNTWVKSVSTSGAVIKAGQKKTIVLAVSANDSLDSGDIDSDEWYLGVSSIRFLDGQGVTTTESLTLDVTDDNTTGEPAEQAFDFASFASAAAVELKVALKESDNNTINKAHIINARTGSTDNDDITILSFTMEAKGSDIKVEEFPVVLTTSGEADEAVLLKAVHLYRGSTKVGSESVPTGGSVTFDNLDFTVTEGSKDSFQVRVDVQDIEGVLDEGDEVQATMTSGVLDTGTIAQDEVGENLTSAEISGSANGESSIFRVVGFNITLVSTSAVISHAGDVANASDHDQGTFKVTFDVTSWDGDIYIDETVPDASGGATESDLDFLAGQAPTLTTSSITCSTGCEDGTNALKVAEGETERFTITAVLTPTGDGLNDVALMDLLWATSDIDGDLGFTYNLDDFKTPQLFLNMDQ